MKDREYNYLLYKIQIVNNVKFITSFIILQFSIKPKIFNRIIVEY